MAKNRPQAERADRLRQALRANLQRRKQGVAASGEAEEEALERRQDRLSPRIDASKPARSGNSQGRD